MHSPELLTLPLMVQSGEGATGPDADANRTACALAGGLAAPRIVVFLLRTRQSLGALAHAAAAIGRPDMTGPAFVLDMLCEFVARGNAAGPAFALGVEAKLICRRRVDAAEANAAIADLDLVAVADFRHAGDVGGLSHRRHQQDRGGGEAGREFHRRSRGDGVIISVRDPRSAFNFALPGRANSEWRMAVEQGPLSPPY